MLSCSASYSDKPILRDKQTQTRDLSSIIPQPLSLPLPPTFPHFPPPSSLVLPDLAFPQWGRTPMNRDVGTGPVAQWATHSFVHLFACTAHSLACTAHSLACSALLAHSLTPELMGKWMIRWLFLLCFFLFWTIVHGSMWRKKEKMSSVPFICVFASLYTVSVCSLSVHFLLDNGSSKNKAVYTTATVADGWAGAVMI